MADDDQRDGPSLAERLLSEPDRFEFAQLVKLLGAHLARGAPVGVGVEPQKEALRFRSGMGLAAPAAPVEAVWPPRETGEPVEVEVSFLALAGLHGPLPDWVAELVTDRVREGDTALRDFLDLFHHRLLSLFFRALEKTRPALHHGPPDETRMARTGFALLGLGLPSLRGRLRVPDRALLPYTGLAGPGPRSQVGLERLLEGYFGVPAAVEPFQPRWWSFDEGDVTRLGVEGRGQNQALGQGAVLGRRVREQTAAITVRLGPLGLEDFVSFLPIGRRHPPLTSLVRFYLGPELEYSLLLVLRPQEVPRLRLTPTRVAEAGERALLRRVELARRPTRVGEGRLGWTTWLGGRSAPGQSAEVVLAGERRSS